MQTRVENGHMVMTGFNGAFASGTVQMAGRVSSSGTGAQRADIRLNAVDLGQVLPLAGGISLPFLKGVEVSGIADASWEGGDIVSIGQNLTGQFALKIGSGHLTDPAVLAKLAKATGMQNLDPIKFSSGAVEGIAREGHLQLTRLELAGPEFKLVASGDVNVRADDLDLVFNVDVAQKLARQSSFFKLNSVLSLFKGKTEQDGPTPSGSEFVKLPEFALVGSLKKPEFRLGSAQIATAAPEASPVIGESAYRPANTDQAVKDAGKRLASLLKK